MLTPFQTSYSTSPPHRTKFPSTSHKILPHTSLTRPPKKHESIEWDDTELALWCLNQIKIARECVGVKQSAGKGISCFFCITCVTCHDGPFRVELRRQGTHNSQSVLYLYAHVYKRTNLVPATMCGANAVNVLSVGTSTTAPPSSRARAHGTGETARRGLRHAR